MTAKIKTPHRIPSTSPFLLLRLPLIYPPENAPIHKAKVDIAERITSVASILATINPSSEITPITTAHETKAEPAAVVIKEALVFFRVFRFLIAISPAKQIVECKVRESPLITLFLFSIAKDYAKKKPPLKMGKKDTCRCKYRINYRVFIKDTKISPASWVGDKAFICC